MEQQFDFSTPQGIQDGFLFLSEKVTNLTTENQQLKSQIKSTDLLKAEIYELKEKVANLEGTLYKVGSVIVSKSQFSISDDHQNAAAEEQKNNNNQQLQKQQIQEKLIDYGAIFNQITSGSIKENLKLLHEQGILNEKVKFASLKKYQSRGFWFIFKDKPVSAVKYIADLCMKVIDFTDAEDSKTKIEQYAANGKLDQEDDTQQQ